MHLSIRKNTSKITNKTELGASLIEALLVIPFLLTITFLSLAFMDYVRSYTISSQTIRESAQIGAIFTRSELGSEFCTCLINQREEGQSCESQCPSAQSFESLELNCDLNATYDVRCSHLTALNKMRFYLASINISNQLIELNLTTRVNQLENDVIFRVDLTGEHRSIYEVFGARDFDMSAFAFMREDLIPEEEPCEEDEDCEENPEPTPNESESEQEGPGNPDGPTGGDGPGEPEF